MDPSAPNLDRSVLLTIDMQVDFARPDGRAYIEGTEEVIRPLARVVRAFRQADRPIIHVIRLYLPDGSNAELCRRAGIREGTAAVRPGHPGSDLVGELLPQEAPALEPDRLLAGRFQRAGPRESIMYKPRWGAFYETPLEPRLDELGVDTLIVGGCNYPNCPRTTVYEASERDYRLAILKDGTSGLSGRGAEELRGIGVRVWPSRRVIGAVAPEE